MTYIKFSSVIEKTGGNGFGNVNRIRIGFHVQLYSLREIY